MKFRIASDFHFEFYGPERIGPSLPIMDDESNTVLLLAGDIGIATKPETYMPFIRDMSERFHYVVHIAGNHEFYKGSIVNARQTIKDQYINIPNVDIFEREIIEFDDVRIIMATMWTDMDSNNPLTKIYANDCMNDYRQITTGNAENPTKHKLTVEDTIEDHIKSRDFIFTELHDAKLNNKKTIVMTHHAPSELSISPKFKNDMLNGAFVSNLNDLIIDLDYAFTWIHGHVHSNHDYYIQDCHVICNPHGYANENANFNPMCTLEL